MDERRQLPRWEINEEAKVWMPQTQEFCHCVIEDMNLKGMKVSFNKRQYSFDVLKMSFSLGNNFDLIKIEAQVPWSRQEGDRHIYGLLFSKITEVDKDKIDKFINATCYDQIKSQWWKV